MIVIVIIAIIVVALLFFSKGCTSCGVQEAFIYPSNSCNCGRRECAICGVNWIGNSNPPNLTEPGRWYMYQNPSPITENAYWRDADCKGLPCGDEIYRLEGSRIQSHKGGATDHADYV